MWHPFTGVDPQTFFVLVVFFATVIGGALLLTLYARQQFLKELKQDVGRRVEHIKKQAEQELGITLNLPPCSEEKNGGKCRER